MSSQGQISDELIKTIIAPLSGYTSLPYRRLLRRLGFRGLYFPEMINPHELMKGKLDKVFSFDDDHPYGIQLFGGFKEKIYSGAIARLLEVSSPVILDLNMGCPVKKVINTGGGVRLLKDPSSIRAILSDIRSVWKGPLSVKTRIGHTMKDTEETLDTLASLEEFDLSFITVHFRTVKEGFSPPAHWELYEEFRSAVSVPLVLNGGVYTPSVFEKIRKKYNPDGIMLARGILYNPVLFKGESPSLNRKIGWARELIEDYASDYGVSRLHEIRKMMVYLFKGEIYSKKIKEKLFKANTLKEYLESFDFYGV